jgi:Putative zinc-finger
VLGGLDADEADAVRRHLAECSECAAERDALAPLPGLLAMAGGAEQATSQPLSAAFEERLLDAYARDRAASPRRRHRLAWRRPRPRVLAVAVAGVAAAAVALVVLLGGGADEPARDYEVTFRSVGAGESSRAWANLESEDEGTTLHLWVRGLPRDEAAVYEVLCDAESWTASAGTFHTDAEGRAYVTLTTALRRGEYNAIRIVRRGHRADGRLFKRAVLTARLS